MISGYPTSNVVLGLKSQRSRSQGHNVQKQIEADRVAGVNYALYRVPTAQPLVIFVTIGVKHPE